MSVPHNNILAMQNANVYQIEQAQLAVRARGLKQIQEREEKDPNQVNKVPVQTNVLNNMSFGTIQRFR